MIVRPSLRPLVQAADPRHVLQRGLGFSPSMLFATGAAGVWFDRQDLGSMYQDSAGTTACAVGSPVGLALDKSKGAVLGAERVTNSGPFTTAAASAADQAADLNNNSWYRVTYTASGANIANIILYANGFAATHTVLAGTNSVVVPTSTATATATDLIRVSGLAAGTLTIQSIREIPGNHATQGTSASRFVLTQDAAGRYHAPWDGLDDSMTCASGGGATAGFFFCAAITVSGGAATARTLWSDVGANTGYRVRVNASNQLELAAGNGVAFTSVATVATLPVGETHVVTAWDDGTNLNVQIDSGAVASVARPVVSAGTAGITIAKDNGAATSFFNGRDYGMVYRTGTAPTATELARTKRFLGARAGVSV